MNESMENRSSASASVMVHSAAALAACAGGFRKVPKVPRKRLAKPLCSLWSVSDTYLLIRTTGWPDRAAKQ